MLTLRLAPLLLMMGCPPPVLEVPKSDSDSSGGDDTEVPCTLDELEWSLRTQDEQETVTASFPSGEPVVALAAVRNPCSSEMTLRTPVSCIVRRWTLNDGSGPLVIEEGCAEGDTDWQLPPGGSATMGHTFEGLAPGSWHVSVEFASADGAAETDFEVVAR